MSATPFSRRGPVAWAAAVFCASVFCASVCCAGGEGEGGAGSAGPAPISQHLLLIEPRNLRAEVFVLVPGARQTVFSAARPGRIGARRYAREDFRKAYPGGWGEFFEKGRAAAAAHLKTLKPRFRRDSKKVIEYALLESDHPLTASTIIAPGFRALFTDTLGDELLVAVPDRSTVIVFPKLAGGIATFYPVLADLYADAVYPASPEIFELTKDGIRAVGAFRSD